MDELSREQIEDARRGYPCDMNALADMAIAYLDAKKDAGRLDWMFSKLNDAAIAEKLTKVSTAHAFGGQLGIPVGDFRAAIDQARGDGNE